MTKANHICLTAILAIAFIGCNPDSNSTASDNESRTATSVPICPHSSEVQVNIIGPKGYSVANLSKERRYLCDRPYVIHTFPKALNGATYLRAFLGRVGNMPVERRDGNSADGLDGDVTVSKPCTMYVATARDQGIKKVMGERGFQEVGIITKYQYTLEKTVEEVIYSKKIPAGPVTFESIRIPVTFFFN